MITLMRISRCWMGAPEMRPDIPQPCAGPCVRGIAKEKMMRQQGVRAVLEVGEGVYKKVADPEAHHEIEETRIHKYMSLSGASEPHGRGRDAGPNSTVGPQSRAPTNVVGHL